LALILIRVVTLFFFFSVFTGGWFSDGLQWGTWRWRATKAGPGDPGNSTVVGWSWGGITR
jgi:hypothetical protein